MTLLEKINETRDFLQAKGVTAPEFGLILGSGLGELAEEIENPKLGTVNSSWSCWKISVWGFIRP